MGDAKRRGPRAARRATAVIRQHARRVTLLHALRDGEALRAALRFWWARWRVKG